MSDEDHVDVLLIQARRADDPMLQHERDCFAAKLQDAPTRMDACTVVNEEIADSKLDGYDVVLIGGSGEFSFVKGGFEGQKRLINCIERVLDRRIPMFASCFGFHAISRLLGGKLVNDPERAELGTYKITLTPEGERDPIFKSIPNIFDAQLGHNDSVVELPSGLINLASSERCDIQAVRHEKAPVIATQFHPELSAFDILERFYRYIDQYQKPGETREEAEERVRDALQKSPHTQELFRYFISKIVQYGESLKEVSG